MARGRENRGEEYGVRAQAPGARQPGPAMGGDRQERPMAASPRDQDGEKIRHGTAVRQVQAAAMRQGNTPLPRH
jgi:hypothetical protein